MVSVIIPCCNNNRTIGKAVASVLEQTVQDFEIIIIDNGNADKQSENVESVLEGLSIDDNRIMLHHYDMPMGAAKARNEGVRLASGEYIAFLDADDYWDKDKLRKQLKVMEEVAVNGESPVICFSGRALVDNDGNELGRVIGCEKVVRYKRLLRTNQINCSSVLMRRLVALDNPFSDGDIHEDYAVWLKLLKKGGYAAGINQPLICYRCSKGSRSGNKLKSAKMNYRTYRYIGLSVVSSLMHMVTYTIEGFKKYGIVGLK